jgi:tRNA G37 N-methylase TrmD
MASSSKTNTTFKAFFTSVSYQYSKSKDRNLVLTAGQFEKIDSRHLATQALLP